MKTAGHAALVALLFLSTFLASALSSTPDYAAIGRETVTALSQQKWSTVEARFDARLKAGLPQDRLSAAWIQITAQAGPFGHIIGINVNEKEGYHVALVTCAFARANLDAKVVIDTEGQIAGLFFVPSVAGASSVQPDYSAIGRETVSALAHGQFEAVESRFDDRMKAGLPQSRLSAVWQQITSQSGDFEHIIGINVSEMDGYHVALVTCAFAHGNLDAKVVIDTEGHIAGLFFVPSATNAAPAANM